MGLLWFLILLIILFAVLGYPPARSWGNGPPGLLGLLLIILLILMIAGAVPWWGWGPQPVVVRP